MLCLQDIWNTSEQEINNILNDQNQSIPLKIVDRYLNVAKLYFENNMLMDTLYNPKYISLLRNLSFEENTLPSLSNATKVYNSCPNHVFTNKTLKKAVNLWCTNKKEALKRHGHISLWDVSQVKNMNHLFEHKQDFNDDLGGWDTQNVTNMSYMFSGCASFNQPLPETWNLQNVTNMSYMFYECKSFNQLLPKTWNLQNVTNMFGMFSGCVSFNHFVGPFGPTFT